MRDCRVATHCVATRVAYRTFVFTCSGSSDWIHIFAKNMRIEREREREERKKETEKFTTITRPYRIDRVFFARHLCGLHEDTKHVL